MTDSSPWGIGNAPSKVRMCLVHQEPTWFKRGMAESTYIAIEVPDLNRDRGRHTLPPIYDKLLQSCDPTVGGRSVSTCWWRWTDVHQKLQASTYAVSNAQVFLYYGRENLLEMDKYWLGTKENMSKIRLESMCNLTCSFTKRFSFFLF